MNKIKEKRILLVEDEPDILIIVKRLLESAGYDVVTACDGKDALEKARKTLPDLIILDLILPGLDGYQICGMLKHDRLYMNIPILILSARSESKDYELGIKVGADDYVKKPFETKTLLGKVAELTK